jgi:hypothetical protein
MVTKSVTLNDLLKVYIECDSHTRDQKVASLLELEMIRQFTELLSTKEIEDEIVSHVIPKYIAVGLNHDTLFSWKDLFLEWIEENKTSPSSVREFIISQGNQGSFLYSCYYRIYKEVLPKIWIDKVWINS